MPDLMPGADTAQMLSAVVAADDGPSLAGYLQRRATSEQFREFVTHRSIYHLKGGRSAHLGHSAPGRPDQGGPVEIQSDEYGGGDVTRMHAELFRTTMAQLDLDTSYGGYLEQVPAVTLCTNNVISLFGLHRKHRGALLGHLAAFEMTSSLPNRRYGNGLRRPGASPAATRFYDEHVQADAVHEQIAAHDLCGSFVDEHPDALTEVLFGAGAALALDRLVAEHLLGSWKAGRTSLRTSNRQRHAA